MRKVDLGWLPGGCWELVERSMMVVKSRDKKLKRMQRGFPTPHVMAPSNIGLEKSGQPTNRRTKVRPKILISQSHVSNTGSSFRRSHINALSLNRHRLFINLRARNKAKMPGATEEPTQVPILDPTSENNEEIDPAIDRDRIRVVRTI